MMAQKGAGGNPGAQVRGHDPGKHSGRGGGGKGGSGNKGGSRGNTGGGNK
jgi:hypothetical protein